MKKNACDEISFPFYHIIICIKFNLLPQILVIFINISILFSVIFILSKSEMK